MRWSTHRLQHGGLQIATTQDDTRCLVLQALLVYRSATHRFIDERT